VTFVLGWAFEGNDQEDVPQQAVDEKRVIAWVDGMCGFAIQPLSIRSIGCIVRYKQTMWPGIG